MKSLKVLAPVVVVVAVLAVGTWITKANAEGVNEETKVASLVNSMKNMNQDAFYALEPIQIERHAVPPDSVDVMRARVSETYSVDGIGEDTVELRGWIAVKHYNAHPVAGETDLNWNTAIVDTEFVGMDLRGHSEKFGPVIVTLNGDAPSRGQVGRIQIPKDARTLLLAQLETDDSVAGRTPEQKAAPSKDDASATPDLDLETSAVDASACEAPLLASISMPDLGLEMKTTTPVLWYSLVDTIPPVGHTASIAIDPVRLVSNGREVATLIGGKVQFREVVRTVVLEPTAADDVMVAAAE